MNTQVGVTGYALAAGKRVAYWAALGLEACRGAHPASRSSYVYQRTNYCGVLCINAQDLRHIQVTHPVTADVALHPRRPSPERKNPCQGNSEKSSQQ